MKKTHMIGAMFALALLSGPSAWAGGVTVDDEARLTIGMKSFINVTNTEVTTNGVTTATDAGLAVDRFYLWMKYRIDDTWSAKITTDVNNEQGRTGSATTPGLKRNMNVFLKNAYVQGNFRPELNVLLGLAGTPWIPYEEGLWRHRYVTNVFVDGYGYDDSADFGVALKGKFADGLFEYFVDVVNGGGYSNPNKTDAVDFGARLTVHPFEGLDISGHFRDGKRGKKTLANPNADDHTLWQGLISYGIDNARIGGGYIDNKVTTVAGSETHNTGFDIWAWYNFMPEFGAFGRYDYKKQTVTGNNVDEKLNRFIVGLEYIYSKVLRFSAVYDYAKADDSANILGVVKKTTKYGLYSQFVF
ncbi:MAG: hypothetical protein ACE5F3_08720 [Mariprofundaceae bacterium]